MLFFVDSLVYSIEIMKKKYYCCMKSKNLQKNSTTMCRVLMQIKSKLDVVLNVSFSVDGVDWN